MNALKPASNPSGKILHRTNLSLSAVVLLVHLSTINQQQQQRQVTSELFVAVRGGDGSAYVEAVKRSTE
jgi:hypothetical protein